MRRYLVFADVGIGLFMASMDMTVVAIAFPHLTQELNTNILWAGWTLSMYQLAWTITLPLAGRLSDTFGRKKIFLFALVLFTATSLLCGLAPNVYLLIFFRLLQGFGGGCFLPTATGIVSDLFPESRQSAIGLFSSIFAVGGLIGPNLGGWLVERFSWRAVFYINVPIGVGLIVLSLFLLPPSKGTPRLCLDLRGASLFSAAVLFIMAGLNLVAQTLSLVSSLLAGGCFTVSLILLSLFLRHERVTPDPILDLVLLRSRPFMAANLYNMVIGAGFFGVFSFVPLFAVSVYKLSALNSGVVLTPRSLGVIVASTITSFLLRRWGYRWPMILGVVITIATMMVLGLGFHPTSLFGFPMGSMEVLGVLMMVSGIGLGMNLPPSNNACIELMPEKVSTITGLRGMFRSMGEILGISVVTLILHLSPNSATGFTLAFFSFGLLLLFALPLIFMMPSGKQKRSPSV